jgi:hypothetical protein
MDRSRRTAGGTTGADEASEIWRQALEDLRGQMEGGTFNTHLSGSWPLRWEPEANAWIIGVRGVQSPEWLRHRLDPLIRRVLARHTPGLPEPQIKYVCASPVVPGAAVRPQAQPLALEAAQRERPPGPEAGASQAGSGAQDARRPASGSPSGGRPDRSALPAARAEQDDSRAKAELGPNDYYIKLKTAFRMCALYRLKGAKLPIFLCLALHVDSDGLSAPGIERIMRETGLARSTVCSALRELASPPLSLIEKMPGQGRLGRRGPDRYRILGYAWFGNNPAPALFELETAM